MASAMAFTFGVLLVLSVPIAVVLGVSGLVGIQARGLPTIVAAQQFFVALDKYPLAAVPFFILAGNLMEASGISQRLVEFSRSLVGGIQGGLACTCVVTCMIFAAVSGSSIATTFAIGAILIPAMVRAGYPVGFAAALQATSAELGVIIPPSIPMIVYGIAAEVSIGDLFLAGFGPGILIGCALIGYVLVWCRATGHGRRDGADRASIGVAARRAFLALLMPVIILGGIYGGVFTPTEASVVAVFYALAVGAVVYRTVSLSDLAVVLRKSVLSSTLIMFVIAAAGLFSFLLNRAGIPEQIASWLVATFQSAGTYLLAVNAFLFIVGMFIETGASILVLAPILSPVAVKLGVDPIHFGLIMIVNLALGMVTPPFAVNLFAACTVARVSLDEVVPSLLPFLGVIILCLLAITYIPAIALAPLWLMR